MKGRNIMASFFRRGNKWYYSVDIGFDKDGKRKKQSRGGFNKKKEAEDAVLEIQIEMSKGTFIQEKNLSFREFVDVWTNYYSAQVKPSTLRVRKHETLRLFDYFDAVKIKEITKKQYQDCLLDLMKKGFAENTISGIHGTAKMVFRKAVELEVIKSDPTEFARPPRKQQTLEDIENENSVPKYLEKEDLATFLRFAHDAGLEDDYAIFLTLAYTGVRVGELCALKRDDIKLVDKAIDIRRTYYNPQNNIRKYSLQTPKTKASRRTIGIADKVVNELTLHLARQDAFHELNKERWHDENFVFTVSRYPGYPAYIKLVEARMSRLLRISGLNEELTPHSLRHTHTSLLAEAGVGLEEIMERLGHTDDDTTRRVYLHVTKDMKKEAVRKFDELMNSF
jgi:integrase